MNGSPRRKWMAPAPASVDTSDQLAALSVPRTLEEELAPYAPPAKHIAQAMLAPLALGSRPTRRSASTRIVAGSTPTASNSGPAMPSFCVSSAINRCAGMICGLPAVVAACIAEVSAAWVFVVGLNESTTPPFIGGKNACPLAQRSQG